MDIKNHGVVFTPEDIVKFMVSYINNQTSKNILEPSCGTGNFLKHLDKKHNITCVDINKEYSKICSKKYSHAKCIHKNFIDFVTDEKFDYIIGNPPYVKIQNINAIDMSKIKKEYPEFIQGNTNLYIYFIIKCFNLLKENGKLIFIVPNTWLYSKSFSHFKEYVFQNRLIELLIDFKCKQVFENVSTYTSIIILTKKSNKYYYYGKDMAAHKLVKKYYEDVKRGRSKLLNYMSPKIGLMTLKDAVFIIKDYTITDKKVIFEKDNNKYIIERDACKTILKVSKNKLYLIIYPYDSNQKIIKDLNKKFPLTYQYLLRYRKQLDARDNGKHNYPKWYAYGRTQALQIKKGRRLFISTIVKNIRDYLIEKDVDLYYSGLCIEPKHNKSINFIKQQLIANEKAILEQSNNKANNWYGLSLNSFR